MHKYLFMEISNDRILEKKKFKTRAKGISRIEKLLEATDNEVITIFFRDERHHQQEFICDQGLRFLIYRI